MSDLTNNLKELYGENAEEQLARYEHAVLEFAKLYIPIDSCASEPEQASGADLEQIIKANGISAFSAPGRTEVGGNHTDHQHGKVLAAAIDSDAIAIATKNQEDVIRFTAEGFGSFVVDISEDLEKYRCNAQANAQEAPERPKKGGTTEDLVRGVLVGIKRAGGKFGGFNAYITSDVLIGSGLSSSAAFELLIGTTVNGLFNDMKFSPVELAKIGQFAENEFFGKPCGLMDQLASAVGGLCFMDFADPAEPVIKRVDCDFDKFGYDLCITNTGGSHADLTGDYAAVRAEMEAVAGSFGKTYLRGISASDVIANAAAIRESCGDRALLRALHFCIENDRVDDQVAALERGEITGDITEFLKLVKASGDSSFKYLQNVYPPVSAATEQNMSVALAISDLFLSGSLNDGAGDGAGDPSGGLVSDKMLGVCRVHGGGFAGTIQAFVLKSRSEEYKQTMNAVFGEGACRIYSIRKQGAVRVI